MTGTATRKPRTRAANDRPSHEPSRASLPQARRGSPGARLERVLVAIALLLLAATAAAQYAGSYVLPTDDGTVTLLLEQQDSYVQGELDMYGSRFAVNGEIDDSGLYGTIGSGADELYFEAELVAEGLYLIAAALDPATGRPDPATAGEYLFQRAAPVAEVGAPGTGAATRGGKLPPTSAPAGPGAPATTGAQAGTGASSPAGASAQPADMQPAQLERRYEGGTRIGSHDAGVSFVVPQGYYAGYHAGENAFMVVSDSQPGLVVVEALSHLPLDEALAQLGTAFASGDTTLYPQGQPQVADGVARARYSVVTPQGQLALYLMGVAGPSANVLIVGGLGAPHESGAVEALVEAIAGSTVMTPPTRASAQNAAAQLAGARLGRSSSTSSSSTNDSHFSSSSTSLDLCANGGYAFVHRSQVSASVTGVGGGGVDASSSDMEEDQGSWSVESGLLGPVVVLRSAQGGAPTFLGLLEASGTLYVDGQPVRVAQSSNCF